MLPYILAEWKKMQKGAYLAVGLLMLSFSSFIGLFIFFYNLQILTPGTETRVLWGQLTFIYTNLLFSSMLAIFTSMILMPEFKRGNFELLRANNISLFKLLIAKLSCLVIINVPIQLMLLVIFIIAAQLSHHLNYSEVLVHTKWTLIILLTSIPIFCLQSYLTVKYRTFGSAVGIGTIGGLASTLLVFLDIPYIRYCYPYSLPSLAARAREIDDLSQNDYSLTSIILILISSSIWSLLFFYLTLRKLKEKA